MDNDQFLREKAYKFEDDGNKQKVEYYDFEGNHELKYVLFRLYSIC